MDSKPINENAKARMGRYASGAHRLFKRNLAQIYTQLALSVWQKAEIYRCSTFMYHVLNHSVSSKVHSTARPLRKPGIHFAFAYVFLTTVPKPNPGEVIFSGAQLARFMQLPPTFWLRQFCARFCDAGSNR